MLKELLEKRDKLIADARAALDEIRKNTDEARATELDKRHDDIMAEVDKLDAQIAREERQAKLDKAAEERRAQQRPIGADTEARGQDNLSEGEITYRDAFYAMLACGGDPSALPQEQREVLRATAANLTPEMRAQLTTTGAAGGYTVPTELADFIVRSMKAWGPMYDGSIVTDITTAAATRSTSRRSTTPPTRRRSRRGR
jgi:HK97 family phage major capsid protein